MFGSNARVLPKRRRDFAVLSTRRIALKKYFFYAIKPGESQRSLSVINASELSPEVVLCPENRKLCAEKLQLYRPPRLPTYKEPLKAAAVLVPLCTHKGKLGLLYTLRSTRMNRSRGEVSFPGGMQDENDGDPVETALRETWEELNIPKDQVDVWASGNVIRSRHVRVTPVLGYIGEVDPRKLKVNLQEVEEAFVLSLGALCHPAQCRFTQFRNSHTLPTYLGGEYRIWGLTAVITHLIMNILAPNVYSHRLTFIQPIQSSQRDCDAKTNVQPFLR